MPRSHIKATHLTQNKTLKAAAQVVSAICHPVFMPVAMAFFLYKISPVSFSNIPQDKLLQWLAVLALNTILFPLITVFLLKKLNFISSIYLRTSKDRIIPLIATMIFYFWTYMVFKNFTVPTAAPQILKIFLLGNFWGIICIFMVNIFKKVSMHAAAAGSMMGIIISLMIMSRVNLFFALTASIIIAGIIGTARLVLRAHTQGEIGLGYFLGVVAQLSAYFYLTYLINIFD